MQAITTKYLGATSQRSSRIKAFCASGSVTIAYDYELNVEKAHEAAALALVKKLGWDTPEYGGIIGGGTDTGYVFVFQNASVKKLRDALGNLCQHVQGNRGNRSGNPYSVPELKAALQALYEDATGRYSNDFEVYCNAAEPFKN